jgi:hypothetical protein
LFITYSNHQYYRLGSFLYCFQKCNNKVSAAAINLLKQITQQHASTSACAQAEKHFKDIKVEWDKLAYKRCQIENGQAYKQEARKVYTGGDALENIMKIY